MDFESIMNRVAGLAQDGVAKAKDLAEVAKLKVNNAAEEDAIRKAYTEIGKLYFAQRGMDPEPAFAALCAKIVESKERIAYNEERVADIRQAGNLSDADVEAVATQIPAEEDAPKDAPAEEDAPAGDKPQE